MKRTEYCEQLRKHGIYPKRPVPNDDDKRGPLTEEELVARFKAMKEDMSKNVLVLLTVLAIVLSRNCPDWLLWQRLCLTTYKPHGHKPSSIIEEMRGLGYDVKVEIPCRNCMENIKEIYRLEIEQYEEHYNEAEGLMPFVFYFRLSPNRPYHEAVVPNTLLCSILLCLLKNERNLQWYTAYSEDWYFVDEHAWGLEYLTGIKFED